MMRLYATRTRILNVADAWRDAFFKNGQWGYPHQNPSPEVKWQQLVMLDKLKATPADVRAIIGNDSWIELRCHACDQSADAVVELGQEPDLTAQICKACLSKALELIP